MDDIKTKVQAKVKEMCALNQELKEKYPQLSNNFWFDIILDKIKEGSLTDQFYSDFSLSDNDLNQIDQTASFFNIDYDLYYDYDHSFPCSCLSFYVIFNFSKPYNQQKARQEQEPYKKINKKQLHKWDIWCAIASCNIVIGAILALFGVTIPLIETGHLSETLFAFVLQTLALITFVVGIISSLINNYQVRQIRNLIKSNMEDRT